MGSTLLFLVLLPFMPLFTTDIGCSITDGWMLRSTNMTFFAPLWNAHLENASHIRLPLAITLLVSPTSRGLGRHTLQQPFLWDIIISCPQPDNLGFT